MIHLVPGIFNKVLGRIPKWKYNFVQKFFYKVGDKVYTLVILENKILVFGIFSVWKIRIMLRLLVWEMWKKLDTPIFEQQILQLEKHGRKCLYCSVLEMRAERLSKSLERETAEAKIIDHWGLRAFSHAVPYIWNGLPVLKHHLLFEPFPNLSTRINFFLFLNLSCNKYHTAFEFLHVCFLY